jgi:hypothetical protein
MIKYLQVKSTFAWSLSNLVALLRRQLFVYRDLFQWLNDHFQAPPAPEGIHDGQMSLPWAVNSDSNQTPVTHIPTRRASKHHPIRTAHLNTQAW